MADHYSTGIVPARVRKPRDKAAVESAVQVVNKRVIGYLAEEVWTVVDDLNAAIADRLVEINEKIRRADGTTRWERFAAEEAHLLQPLPAEGFDTVEWKQLKVGRNYHVSCDSQHYSVPYTYAGQLLRVRVTSTTVTVFDADQVGVSDCNEQTSGTVTPTVPSTTDPNTPTDATGQPVVAKHTDPEPTDLPPSDRPTGRGVTP